MNKKGFVFVETLIVVVVLSIALLMIYRSYSDAIHNEKKRLYYDDSAYLYRSFYIKNFLENNTQIDKILNTSDVFLNTYATVIGSSYSNMFNDTQINLGYKETLNNFYNNLNIKRIILIDGNMFLNCKNNTTEMICLNTKSTLDNNVNNYLKTLNLDGEKKYILFEYSEKFENDRVRKCISEETSCTNNYSTLEI